MNIAKLRISMAFLFGCLIFSSCTTHNEYDYQPTIAALRQNTILLSLLDAKGQAYDYELLMQKKTSLSMACKASKAYPCASTQTIAWERNVWSLLLNCPTKKT